jgi:activating signal cointegrator complex subunit 1
MESFVQNGLTKPQYDSVKLHATVMNTNKRQTNNNEKTNKEKTKRETFDARNILNAFKDFDFGTHTIDRISLSIRYSVASNGYYESDYDVTI